AAWLASTAQPDTSVTRYGRAGLMKRLGKSALRQGDPVSAAFYLEAGTVKAPRDAEMYWLLGTAYRKQRDYERPGTAYLQAYSKKPSKYTEALYHHAMMQKSAGRYDSAKATFELFKDEYRGGNRDMKRSAAREIVFCDSVKKVLAVKSRIRVSRLDTT